ncbi:MAG: NAD(P)/FAD-dependent oxidoreductase [Ignavibacteriales bacterium]|nr:NAD(P)/FAD-dependent oxidoreductase [Ignavibacteriales bacterium]
MDFDTLIIGAGVVGLATSEIFSKNNQRVLVVEKENKIGTGVSSRNSEVIHAGIYYPKDSLKSLLCIRGKILLYEWCLNHKVSHCRLGKYIIAINDEEKARLEMIKENAGNAGMDELYFATSEKINEDEPEIHSVGGLYSPTSGIISAHGLMDSLKVKSQQHGTDFLFCSKVKSITKNSQSTGYFVEITDASNQASEIEVAKIINCAGLYADEVALILGVDDASYKQKFVKGNYFKLSARKYKFNHLVYPVPLPKLHGLGVHITLGLEGEVKFGPDVENLAVRIEEYSVDENRKTAFYEAIKTYLPKIEMDDLIEDMSGIRPRLAADKEFNDFIINEEFNRNLPGIINCVGIESPGLTASLAIAEYIYGRFN